MLGATGGCPGKEEDGFAKRQTCVEPDPARRHEDFLFRSYEGWLRAPRVQQCEKETEMK